MGFEHSGHGITPLPAQFTERPDSSARPDLNCAPFKWLRQCARRTNLLKAGAKTSTGLGPIGGGGAFQRGSPPSLDAWGEVGEARSSGNPRTSPLVERKVEEEEEESRVEGLAVRMKAAARARWTDSFHPPRQTMLDPLLRFFFAVREWSKIESGTNVSLCETRPVISLHRAYRSTPDQLLCEAPQPRHHDGGRA